MDACEKNCLTLSLQLISTSRFVLLGATQLKQLIYNQITLGNFNTFHRFYKFMRLDIPMTKILNACKCNKNHKNTQVRGMAVVT